LQLYSFFPGSRFEDEKKFMALDNISASNYESYKSMVKNLLASGILPCGSRIIITARSAMLLENLRRDLARESSASAGPKLEYRCAITQIPCLTDGEAMDLVTHHYLGRSKHRPPYMTRILPNFSFSTSSSPSFKYIPQVLQLMGVLLRKNGRAHEDEDKLRSDLEDFCAIVDVSKAKAAQTLVGKICKGLPEDLQGLFLDIALFIVPSVGSEILVEEVAVSILSKLQGTTEQMLKMNVRPIKQQSIFEAEISIVIIIQDTYVC
jgi:hypothetical protein